MEIKITLDGIERTITKEQFFELATEGSIGPDTPFSENGRLVVNSVEFVEGGELALGGDSIIREDAENNGIYEYFGTFQRTDLALVSTDDNGDFVVFLDGVEQTITEKQLRDLAAQGIIGPNTPIYHDGEPVKFIECKQQHNFKRIATAVNLASVVTPLFYVGFIFVFYIRFGGQIPDVIPRVMGLYFLGMYFFLIYLTDNLARSCRTGLFTRLLLMFGMFMPCINIIIFLCVLAKATGILREDGFDIGFFGVDMEPFEKLFEEQEEVDSRPFYAKMRFVLPLLLLTLSFAVITFVATIVF